MRNLSNIYPMRFRCLQRVLTLKIVVIFSVPPWYGYITVGIPGKMFFPNIVIGGIVISGTATLNLISLVNLKAEIWLPIHRAMYVAVGLVTTVRGPFSQGD